MGPVLLLDVGVVVLLVRAAAGELNLLRLAVVPQVLIDELRAVVGVDAAQAEGQRLPELLQGGLDRGLALAEDGGGLHPRGVDVGQVEGVHELAVAPATRVGDEVDLGKAGGGHTPAVCFERDVVLEQGARFRPSIQASRKGAAVGGEATIHLARTDAHQLLLHRGAAPTAATAAGARGGAATTDTPRLPRWPGACRSPPRYT